MPNNRIHLTGYSGVRPLPPAGDAERLGAPGSDRGTTMKTGYAEPELEKMAALQEERVRNMSSDSALTKEEISLLENFWNEHLHVRRERVPVPAVIEREMKKLTNREDSEAALRVVVGRIGALMRTKHLYDIWVVNHEGKICSYEVLELNNNGIAHFASSFPGALRNPLLFARRHLSLFQIIGVVSSMAFGLAALLLRVFGWGA